MENIKVTLVKSTIACKRNQVETAKSLGLKRPGDSIVLAANPAVMGKVKTISHLIKVETV